MRTTRHLTAILIAIGIVGLAHMRSASGDPDSENLQPDPELMAYGEYLAGECVTCHRRDGLDEAIPAIAGMPEDAFVSALRAYQSGARTNPAMVSAARALDDGQIEALSTYFATLTHHE